MDMDIDIDPRMLNLSHRELQGKCKEHGLPAQGKKKILQKNLQEYMDNPKDTLKRLLKEAIQKKGYVDWKSSAAREIMLEDLEPPNGWLCGKDDLDAKHVYNYCKARYADYFENVPFKQFESKYQEAMQTAGKRRARSRKEEEMLAHDRRLHPRQTKNNRDEPIWDLDEEAKALLKFDLEEQEKPDSEKMSPSSLWLSREVHQKYKLRAFRQRIYQHERTLKFYNLLEKKRTEKRDTHKAKMTPMEVTFERVTSAKVTKRKTKINESRQLKRKRDSDSEDKVRRKR